MVHQIDFPEASGLENNVLKLLWKFQKQNTNTFPAILRRKSVGSTDPSAGFGAFLDFFSKFHLGMIWS